MKNIILDDQKEMCEKTNLLIKNYGIKIKWVSEQTNIFHKALGAFLNSKTVLNPEQYERLINFVERYEKHMNGFFAD